MLLGKPNANEIIYVCPVSFTQDLLVKRQ